MTFNVSVSGSGLSYPQDDHDSILHAALRSGIGFPYECSAGSCGMCRFELVSGEVRVNWEQAPAWTDRDKRKGRYLGCQTSARDDCEIRVHLSPDSPPPIRLKRFAATLVEKRYLTHDMAMLTLRTAEPAEFLPGQYALITSTRRELKRPYSMANLPNDQGLWQFIVRKTPGGALSALLLDAQPGETLIVDGPLGSAYFQDAAPEPIVCVAGGSGLAPMLSVAKAASSSGRRIQFFYGGRRGVDMTCLSEIEKLATVDAGLVVHAAISDPGSLGEQWAGRTALLPDLVQSVLGGWLARHRVYMAGAPPMIAAMQTMLADRGVPEARIHFDRFF